MLFLRRSISFILSAGMLCPGYAYAVGQTHAPAADAGYTLTQYQAIARQEIQKTPWIKQNKDVLVAIGGTTVSVGTVAAVLMKYKEKQIKEAAQYSVQRALDQAAVSQKKAEALGQRNKFLHNTNRELAQGNKILVKQNSALQHHFLQELKPAYHRLYVENSVMIPLLEDLRLDMYLISQSAARDAVIDEYFKKIASSQYSKAQKMALMEEMTRKEWFKKLGTPAQQKEFLTILKNAIEAAEHQRVTTIRHMFASALSARRHRLGVEFLSAGNRFLYHLFHSRNVFTFGLVLLLGVTSIDVKAQEMAQRVENNFSLFLNATPEELAIMERNPEVKEKCILATEALSTLTQLPQEEALHFLQLLPSPQTAAEKINQASLSNR